MNRSLDRESIDSYTLTVLAVDNGMPAMRYTELFIIASCNVGIGHRDFGDLAKHNNALV